MAHTTRSSGSRPKQACTHQQQWAAGCELWTGDCVQPHDACVVPVPAVAARPMNGARVILSVIRGSSVRK